MTKSNYLKSYATSKMIKMMSENEKISCEDLNFEQMEILQCELLCEGYHTIYNHEDDTLNLDLDLMLSEDLKKKIQSDDYLSLTLGGYSLMQNFVKSILIQDQVEIVKRNGYVYEMDLGVAYMDLLTEIERDKEFMSQNIIRVFDNQNCNDIFVSSEYIKKYNIDVNSDNLYYDIIDDKI
jgi:hypothetical protein